MNVAEYIVRYGHILTLQEQVNILQIVDPSLQSVNNLKRSECRSYHHLAIFILLYPTKKLKLVDDDLQERCPF